METVDLETVRVGHFNHMHTRYTKGKMKQSFIARNALKGNPVS